MGAKFYLLRNLNFPMVFRRLSANLLVTVPVVTLAAALYGCGQKGDLYLPDQPPPRYQKQSECRTASCSAAVSAPATDPAASTDAQSQPEKPEPTAAEAPEEIPEETPE